jgi:anti-anti-sigma factor
LRGGSNGHKAIVLDVSQVEFMDSTGLTMLIRAHEREPERFALRGHSPAVEHVLELSATSRLFTRADAVKRSDS